MVALGGDFHPVLGIGLGECKILLGRCLLAAHPAEIPISGETQDGFDR